MGRGLLFLDFDGVMHPYGCSIDLYFCHIELLESWLRQRSGLDVVISSSWRDGHPFDEIQSYFSADLRPRIIGTTPILARESWEQHDGVLPPMRFEREAEIRRWLARSEEPWRPWAALDDQAWLFKPFCPHLVVCDGQVGLTQREFDQADAVLGSAA